MKVASPLDYLVRPGRPLRGCLRIPGDKSISHRALILAAVAEGETTLRGLLRSEDVAATWQALEALGVGIRAQGAEVRVRGVGLHGLRPPAAALELGNSGTSARLFAGLLSGRPFSATLKGDASLSRRPMRRVIVPLRRMGARLRASAAGTLPLHIAAGPRLRGIAYRLPVASAQLKSCLLLAGLGAEGETCLREPAPTRDHTERLLSRFGRPAQRAGLELRLSGGGGLRGTRLQVPGDLSSAAFLLVAASIVPGSELRLEGVGVNPTRRAVLEILEAMGADLELRERSPEWGAGDEPVADLTVRAAAGLTGIDIPRALVAPAIDELPVLMVAAACARGRTRLRGAGELRVKESDRIAAIAAGLQALGVEVVVDGDGMDVRGGRLQGGSVASGGDHRIAMSFAVAGLAAEGSVRIADCGPVATSFPGFADLLRQAGADLRVAGDEGAGANALGEGSGEGREGVSGADG